MKKVLAFLVLAISLMACEGPMGPMGPTGMDGRDGYNGKDGQDGKDGQGAHWFERTITIQPYEWELYGGVNEYGSFFHVNKAVPQITREIYNGKAILAYIETEKGQKNGMPYVLHKGITNSYGEEVLWTQTYDFDYSVGSVNFYLTYSDFITNNKPDGPITFYLILIW